MYTLLRQLSHTIHDHAVVRQILHFDPSSACPPVYDLQGSLAGKQHTTPDDQACRPMNSTKSTDAFGVSEFLVPICLVRSQYTSQ